MSNSCNVYSMYPIWCMLFYINWEEVVGWLISSKSNGSMLKKRKFFILSIEKNVGTNDDYDIYI